MAEFKDFELRIVNPQFASPLTNLIIDLDYLRKKPLHGSTGPIIFFQLKEIFHMLESIASARIEGNHTTIIDYVESKIDKSIPKDSGILEIENMEECLDFIEKNILSSKIDRAFVSELHKLVVADLPSRDSGEGDETPGKYRTRLVTIKNSPHITPDPIQVANYMEELFGFINRNDEQKYDLLKTAISHHRFVWIHPFNNGNGRTVRLLTYAMLIKYGFNVGRGRILNPAAVFCSDREEYYNKLTLADEGKDENILAWCEYVLKGLKIEIEKIDRLLEYDFLKTKVLVPAVQEALEKKWITQVEFRILRKAIDSDNQVIKASDLGDIVISKHLPERSRVIRKLKEKKMIMPVGKNKRKYAICFQNNYLLRSVVGKLYDEGFVPPN